MLGVYDLSVRLRCGYLLEQVKKNSTQSRRERNQTGWHQRRMMACKSGIEKNNENKRESGGGDVDRGAGVVSE